MKSLLKNALVLQHAASGLTIDPLDILIDGSRIEEVSASVDGRDAEVVDCSGRLAIPGFVNAHTHSWAAFQKGRYDNMPLELWMLKAYPFVGVKPLDPRLIYLRTMLFAIESIRSGVTCILDDVLELPSQSFASLDAVTRAYDEIGIRAYVSGHVIDRSFADSVPFVRDVAPASAAAELHAAISLTTEDYCSFTREAIRRFHQPDGRVRYAISPSAPQRCTDEMLVAAYELAVAHDLAYHMHVLETRVQVVTGQVLYGKTIIEHLDDLGVLDNRTMLAHAIWISDDDVGRIAAARASVVHNPNSNLKTGAGIAPFREWADAGINIALGTDSVASNGSARMFDVMRSAGLLHKITEPDYSSWPTATEILGAATEGGAKSLGAQNDLGQIAPGMRADIVLLNLNTLNFTPLNDIRNHLVYSENGESVESVYVDGALVLDSGRLTRIDEEGLLDELRGLLPAFLADYAAIERENARFEPYFAEIYRRCSEETLAINRYGSSPDQWWRHRSRAGAAAPGR
jgi:5-methylthioadenosine/S-adenosylhomocysteine deaminase